MDSFRFKSSKPTLSAQSIQVLRKFTNLGIAELKRRAADYQPLLEFAIFDNDWQESKLSIRHLLTGIESGELPLEIFEHHKASEFQSSDEFLSPRQLQQRLQMLDEISIEQDMLTQLELGYISSREEYEPTDEA